MSGRSESAARFHLLLLFYALACAPPLLPPAAARLFSWVDVPTSAFAFSVGASLLVAHGLLGYTLAGVAAQSAVVALLASAGVVLYNAVMEGKALPPPRIPVHPDTLARASTVAGERAAAALARSNELLSWRDMGASARALAYAWLVYRFSWLLSPRVLIAGWVAAFVATPAYAAASAPVDAALARHVLPLVATIQVRARGGERELVV